MKTIYKKALFFVGGFYGLFCVGAGYAATSLPNGADSLNEGYQDWSLACHARSASSSASTGDNTNRPADTSIQCRISQRALDGRTGGRVLTVQLEPDGEQVRGLAVLPFGLDLGKGLTISTAAQPAGDVYSFSTCMPQGCLVPLSFDEGQLASLLKTPFVTLTVFPFSGQTMKLAFSTKGLAAALARARSLSR